MFFPKKHLALTCILGLTLATPLLSQGAENNVRQSEPAVPAKTAGNNPALAPTELRTTELEGHPFEASGITLTILDFTEKVSPRWLFATYITIGVGGITVKVENKSQDFVSFSPDKLIFLGHDGNQATVANEQLLAEPRLPRPIQLAPGGRFQTKYTLTAAVALPARIYYGEKLLAEVRK
jgi:hypothetical protein